MAGVRRWRYPQVASVSLFRVEKDLCWEYSFILGLTRDRLVWRPDVQDLPRLGQKDLLCSATDSEQFVELPMGPSVYIETSIVSFLTARASRDVVQAARQRVTQDWWTKRSKFDLFISNLVLSEVAAGDSKASERRLLALDGIPELTVTSQAIQIAEALIRGGALPPRAAVDAFHIAIAAAHEIDYLLTWNCKHIANATMRGTIEDICRDQGVDPPVICTPEQLPSRNTK